MFGYKIIRDEGAGLTFGFVVGFCQRASVLV